ncbi:MAG: hypothetical protein P4L61_00185 [Candidatus Pacebacteria bacterium]|nr:hypothetical protein [Candidatus Paceibacterota bacterium]
MTSYEGLADAAYSAAVNVEKYLNGKDKDLNKLDVFSRLLSEPLIANSEYKLLYDARIVPLYRSVWSEFKGIPFPKKNTDTLLSEISSFIKDAKSDIEKNNMKAHGRQVAKFCLMLNKMFLEKNADMYETSFRSRVSNAVAGVDGL